MKTLSLAVLLVASLAFVMVGCSDNSTLPVSPIDQPITSTNSSPSLAKGGPVHSVTGNVNLWIDGKMGVLTVNGHLYADESVKGEVNLVTTAYNPLNSKLHGKVVALKFYESYTFDNGVTGPTVLFWWREQTFEGLEGLYVCSFVVDNGRDANGVVRDWSGPVPGAYEVVDSDLSPQDIVDLARSFFLPTDVGNVTIR